jgi:ribosome-associated heat shock protein Hsp15
VSEGEALRLDKWLWHARFIRTRALATELVGQRRVRINDQLVAKTHHLVRPGDVITLRQGERLHVLRVAGLGLRRGPASEARRLYTELDA